jgi:hypothetical protein
MEERARAHRREVLPYSVRDGICIISTAYAGGIQARGN